MTSLQTRKLLVLFASVVSMLGSVAPALAQSGGSSATDSTSASAPATKAQRKADRKAARKQARAKNTAELKKLESNGYQPTQSDPNYPQNLQNAQKKANAGQAVNQ